MELKQESDCRLAYRDILRGYSCNESHKLYLRHYNELDLATTEEKRRSYQREATKQGLLSESDKLDLLAKHGHWTIEEEKGYKEHLEELEGLRQSSSKLIISWQIEDMAKRTAAKEQEIRNKFSGRNKLIGMTKEDYANRRASENHVLRSFYRDPALSTPHFSDEDIDELSADDMKIFMDIYYDSHELFKEKNFKRIAVCPFFLNSYLLSNENPHFFFGGPIARMSVYQLALFSRGQYYKNILEETPARPPDEYYDDLDKVIKFYDLQFSLIQSKRKQK